MLRALIVVPVKLWAGCRIRGGGRILPTPGRVQSGARLVHSFLLNHNCRYRYSTAAAVLDHFTHFALPCRITIIIFFLGIYPIHIWTYVLNYYKIIPIFSRCRFPQQRLYGLVDDAPWLPPLSNAALGHINACSSHPTALSGFNHPPSFHPHAAAIPCGFIQSLTTFWSSSSFYICPHLRLYPINIWTRYQTFICLS